VGEAIEIEENIRKVAVLLVDRKICYEESEGKRKYGLRLNIEIWVLCLIYGDCKEKEGRKIRTKKKARNREQKYLSQMYKTSVNKIYRKTKSK
jgi:hypothetical protein